MLRKALRHPARRIKSRTLGLRARFVSGNSDRRQLVNQLLDAGSYRRARELLTQMPPEEQDQRWVERLAAAALGDGDLKTARDQLHLLIEGALADAPSWIRLAKLAEKADAPAEALTCWLAAEQLSNDPVPILRAALLLHKAQRFDEEIELLDSALDRGLEDLRIRRRLAGALDTVGDAKRAETQWRMVVRQDPNDRAAARSLTRAMDRALLDLDHTISIRPGVNPLLRFADSPEFIEHKASMDSRTRPARRPWHTPIRLLLVSANWNFMTELIRVFDDDERIEVRSLDYLGVANRIVQSVEGTIPSYASYLFEWADVIFVEWANDTLIWVLESAPADCKIVTRLHSYELLRRWPMFADWTRIDDCIFVAEHNRRRLLEAINIEEYGCRAHVIPNVTYFESLLAPKTPTARHTLGMAGYNTPNKQPLIAFDIIESLRKYDARWQLRVIGHPWREPSPLDGEYDHEFRQRCAALEENGALKVDAWTSDLATWFRDVGVALSCSEREGTHEAIREGIASGACGLVRNWPWAIGYGGAQAVFPDSHVYDDIDEAVEYLLNLDRDDRILSRGAEEREALLKREDPQFLARNVVEVLIS
jgi:tetratricopeptide (TPR) repeat protein